jgi:hypothetical protein
MTMRQLSMRAARHPRLRRGLAHAALPPLSESRFLATTRRATTVLAQLLASACRRGDTLCLHGAVGMGKSYFWHVNCDGDRVVLR